MSAMGMTELERLRGQQHVMEARAELAEADARYYRKKVLDFKQRADALFDEQLTMLSEGYE